jgi:structural maintenance of chromosome 3 (chondroitin sulfate proteoglycan 6)
MSAYVEIIFDNSDDRFPTGKDELILRRTIGLKKDEYSLDRKNATKSDVMNLLESAGFSRSNPYYIVPQGRVTTLTNMKDPERLLLLKEVAGTQVYEARRAESLKIMNETNNKRAKIDELLEYINERLSELEEEKDELRSFQEKDREKRCLEYALYSREQQEIATALETIEEQRQTGVDDTDENREKFIEGEKTMAAVNSQVAQLKQQMEFLRLDKKQLEDERRDNAKARAQVELQVKNLLDGQTAAQQAKSRHAAELQRVLDTIRLRQQELNRILPQYHMQKQQETDVKVQLDEAETNRQRLYQKQGRNARFRGKKERDDWLRDQINDTYSSLSTVKAVRIQTAEDIEELEKNIKKLEPEVEDLQNQLNGRGDAVSDLDQQIQAAKEERDTLMDQRKELWREEAKLDSIMSNAYQELSQAERSLSHMMDGNTSRGIAAVRRVAKRDSLEGVYGTLAELIQVNERYRTAVEVIGGNSLFDIVVDNDETATKVTDALYKERAGRVTCMPLNRLRSKTPNFPNAQDALPLIKRIQFDQRYTKAVEHVFGKTIICPNLSVAANYARSHGVTAITQDGDRADKKGALTGGFHDPRSSRLEAMGNVLKWRNEYDTRKVRDAEIKKEVQIMDQRVTRAMGELQKLEQRKQQAQSSHNPLRQELKSKMDMLRNKKEGLDAKKKQEANIAANVKALSDQQNAHEAELSTDFKKALTAAEEAQLDNLGSTVRDLQRQYSKLSAARSELEGRKSVIEVELTENLQPLLEQLQASELDIAETGSSNLKDQERELNRLTKSLESLEQRINDAEDSIETALGQINTLEAKNADIRREQEDLAKAIERHQRRMEKSMQKKAALQNQYKACGDSIRDLGVLPEEAFTKYKTTSSDAIVKRLHKANEALKKYTSVNKKAFEQYNNFTRQRQTLEERRAELDASRKSIEELIEVLDQRKDEAIERTFKQVSREFATVFEKLVPMGKGRLIIQRKTDRKAQADEDDDSDEEQARRESVENYTGVGISVSFNSKHDDQQRIQQLSGGQKSRHHLVSSSNVYEVVLTQSRSLRFDPYFCHTGL